MKKIAEIKAEFDSLSLEEQKRLWELYREEDARAGVQKLIEQKNSRSCSERKTPYGTDDGV